MFKKHRQYTAKHCLKREYLEKLISFSLAKALKQISFSAFNLIIRTRKRQTTNDKRQTTNDKRQTIDDIYASVFVLLCFGNFIHDLVERMFSYFAMKLQTLADSLLNSIAIAH
uniref:Uncharacterized protein n=1 Tax=Glossina austeni TaxID=7395 RepID=A0A1A9VSY5_GLOAU